MLATLLDYILVSHLSHIAVLGYTLWAIGVLPGSKDTRTHDAPKMLLLVVATLAALVFVDGGISEALYDGSAPEKWLFHLKAFLAVVIVLFYPHLPSGSPNVSSPGHFTIDFFPLVIFGASLALSWIGLPWLYGNFPGFPNLNVNPAWSEVWDILLKIPFETIPLIYALRFVYLDTKQRQRNGINNTPPPHYGALPDYFHVRKRSGAAADMEDDTMYYIVAYFALLPIMWQLNAPWGEMNSFERTISILSTNILIMTVMVYYHRVVRMAQRQEVVAV